MQIMELLSHIGIYPSTLNLTLTNKFKGFLLIWVFIKFILVNGWVNLHLFLWNWVSNWIGFKWVITITYNIKLIISLWFWQSLIYLINKRKIKIIISGLDLNNDLEKLKILNESNCLCLSNHRSLFDFILIYYIKTLVAKKSNHAANNGNTTLDSIDLNFINWNSIWRIPSLHTIWNFLTNDENWVIQPNQLELQLNQIINQNNELTDLKSNWFIHFPEVNIINDYSLALQNQQLDQYLIPKLNETLYPRFKNFNNIVSTITKINNNTASSSSNQFKNLIDFSIVYYNPLQNNFKNPNLFEILTLKQPFFIINIDIKFKLISKLPLREKKLEKWLEHLWLEKDKTIEMMQKQLKINE
ncbi:putative membrane protein [Wickerhamomyces ciferrii]|uniref:Membrane protein n=1 Tax=Wickerhamomyces ciferrii (strain ATCC 14091 / BCRC 22168 / CBS 111 / JCM 3599 / NBRC 0793 / NRRL Y-1031 F-60-10) TaxID=1206466 RepID=K0KE63_WICCF|nr:uncharacterized protein BN7_743 [Wickerhamomyces ciferrii]CCH41206.1 putative membrane protein [Wickerhamomyces ciferrii]